MAIKWPKIIILCRKSRKKAFLVLKVPKKGGGKKRKRVAAGMTPPPRVARSGQKNTLFIDKIDKKHCFWSIFDEKKCAKLFLGSARRTWTLYRKIIKALYKI